MEKKIGRPTDDPKTVMKKVRISETDASRLRACSAKLGKTESEIIRMGINVIFGTLTREEDAK